MALMGDDGRRTKGEQRVGESSMAGGALRACAVRGAAAAAAWAAGRREQMRQPPAAWRPARLAPSPARLLGRSALTQWC